MDESSTDYLELADWRRRIGTLYAEVRALAASDPVAALEHWRTTREWLYREHPQSPVPRAARSTFQARHFPHDPALRFEVPVLRDTAPPPCAGPSGAGVMETASSAIPMSTGQPPALRRVGWLDIPFPTGERRLGLYWIEGYGGGLFLPFRDATNGKETYVAGRYVLDAVKSADLGGNAATGTLIIDFNFAYHPSCAFDPRWACPLAPPENRLDLPIRAGERLV
jgi:uncharacterized protein